MIWAAQSGCGVANAAPFFFGHPSVAASESQVQLFQALVFLLLLLDVRSDHRLVSSHGRHEIPSCPEMLPDKIPLALSVDARQVDRALSLDKPDHLRHRVFRRYRNQHVYMVAHQMAFFNPALLLLSQLPKYLPEMLSQTHV